MNILLTGGNGLIGTALYPRLLEKGYQVRMALRRGTGQRSLNEADIFYFDALDRETDWHRALNGMDVVIHLAGQVPTLKNNNRKAFNEYVRVNFHGTDNLARQAADAGIRRFVFISTIGVLGKSDRNNPLTENSRVNPNNDYARSKLKAEQGLRQIEMNGGMEVVILRPPLVYGPNVRANFLRLMEFVYRGIPLPFAGIQNQRHFIALDNMVDVILTCIEHEAAAGKTFLVSDREYFATGELIKKISRSMGRPERTFYFPIFLSRFLLTLMGKKDLYDKLWRSSRIDSRHISDVLDWQPVTTLDSGIEQTVRWYLAEVNPN